MLVSVAAWIVRTTGRGERPPALPSLDRSAGRTRLLRYPKSRRTCGGGGFLTIAVIARSHPGATDYLDGDWVGASIDVQPGGFRGSVHGHLRAEEVADLHE